MQQSLGCKCTPRELEDLGASPLLKIDAKIPYKFISAVHLILHNDEISTYKIYKCYEFHELI